MSATTSPTLPPPIRELGTDLLTLKRWQLCWTIAIPFVAFAAYWVLAVSQQWVLAVFCTVILSFVTYGSTSHDLVHANLGLKRRTNDLLLSVIEVLALRSGHAYQAAHLNHHARFPHDDDIEARASRMSWPRALLEGMIFQFRTYHWALQHSHRRRTWIIAEGLIVLVIVIGAVVALFWTIVPGVYVGLMISGSWIIPLITSYMPHNADASDPLHQTRLFRGLFVRVVALDHLYHLEHHLYPAVPHLNWPLLARRLDPWLNSVGIEPVKLQF